MKLAYFSPLAPTRSGIADYSATLLPALAAEAEITTFVAPDAPPAVGLLPNIASRPAGDFCPIDFDIPLYQMGNSVHHTYLYRQLLQDPGITVLHEPFLHHFIAHITAGQGDFGAYVREMGYAHGTAGTALARAIGAGQVEHPLHTLPLVERVVDSSLGVIVHSHYARQIVEQSRPGAPIAVIPQPMALRQADPADRAQLNIPPDALLVATAGQATPEKQIPTALHAFAHLRRRRPEAHLLIIGEVPSWYQEIDETIRQLGLETAVHQTGYLPDLNDFECWIAAADICISLRAPTLGETSAGLLRIMALGKPALVCDTGWYAELPPDVCRHVPLISAGEVDQDFLTAALLELANDPAERAALGERALVHIAQHHRLDTSARAYLDFIRIILGRS